ncbi:DUF5959 family protein [Streptomyces sp. NBC_00178]|uniref:DUF5959 family protein n=1 Tax=Streptomyces sp. NBC_00178 TaxID=2975672 RepID=UPI002E289489|nr:DUF5959 family protein [Streptomyces sp. NBC_00178]
MAEGGRVDLVHLTDGENSLRIGVLGRRMPGVLPWHDFLDVEVVVTSAFAHGRLEVCLAPTDLDDWAQVLGELAAGRSATWMDDGRNPGIRFASSGQDGVAVVVVEDVAGSGTSVRVPVRVAGGWTDELEERLGHVRAAWPQEAVETAPGAYEWRRARAYRPRTDGTPEAVGRVV